jgi:MFS family permease
MYHAENAAPPHVLAVPSRSWRRVDRNVWALGFTSLFTDISSEMVASILPLYLVVHLGLTPLAFGVVDGLYQGFAALLRLASGVLADRWRRYKELAAVGYGLSGLSRLGLLAAGASWPALAAVVMIDRTAKGIRTAPRDALISLSSPRKDLGLSFGVHRTMDAAGAMLGPIVAFVLLAQAPAAFDVVFVASFSAAVIGFAVLVLFVSNVGAGPSGAPPDVHRASLRAAIGLLGAPAYRSIVLVGTGLAVVTISDGFLYLALQREVGIGSRLFPLLYVGTAFFYFLLSTPMGRLADRLGRGRMFLAGYGILALAYAGVFAGELGQAGVLICLALLGAYYAATDGVLMALASGILAPEARGAGLALLTTMTNVGKLAASMIFGMVWTAWGLTGAVMGFGCGLLILIGVSTMVLARTGGKTTG